MLINRQIPSLAFRLKRERCVAIKSENAATASKSASKLRGRNYAIALIRLAKVFHQPMWIFEFKIVHPHEV